MIKASSKIDHRLLVRSILPYSISNTQYLHITDLYIEEKIDITIDELQNMTTIEKLNNEYNSTYINATIYIQWQSSGSSLFGKYKTFEMNTI
jgi:hypothetical protein